MRVPTTRTMLATLLATAFLFSAAQNTMAVILDLAPGQGSTARTRDTSPFDGLGDLAQTDQSLQVGTGIFGGPGAAFNSVFAFQMTGAGSGLAIGSADFSVTLDQIFGSPTWNVDLYVNRVSASSGFLASDHESGTLIMADFVTTSDGLGSYSLDTTGQANLLSYMRSNWVEGDYIFLSLKSDPAQNPPAAANVWYRFGGASTSDAQIELGLIPEPSTVFLLVSGGFILYGWRRRSRA